MDQDHLAKERVLSLACDQLHGASLRPGLKRDGPLCLLPCGAIEVWTLLLPWKELPATMMCSMQLHGMYTLLYSLAAMVHLLHQPHAGRRNSETGI